MADVAPPRLLALATAVPPHRLDQDDVRDWAARHFAPGRHDVSRLLPAFDNAGIRHRHSCVPLDWYVKDHGWRVRNQLYLEHAPRLAAEAARVALLDRVAPQLGMRWRLKVIADGDPKFGHAAVFVAVLGRETNDPALDGMFDQDPEDELTAVVLRRCREAGSCIEDEPPRPEDALTLFDEDEEEAKP